MGMEIFLGQAVMRETYLAFKLQNADGALAISRKQHARIPDLCFNNESSLIQFKVID
jgi:hypothetical protein